MIGGLLCIRVVARHRLTLDLWLAKDNRFLISRNPMSSEDHHELCVCNPIKRSPQNHSSLNLQGCSGTTLRSNIKIQTKQHATDKDVIQRNNHPAVGKDKILMSY